MRLYCGPCAQLHSELFGRRHSTLQPHGLFALAKFLLLFLQPATQQHIRLSAFQPLVFADQPLYYTYLFSAARKLLCPLSPTRHLAACRSWCPYDCVSCMLRCECMNRGSCVSRKSRAKRLIVQQLEARLEQWWKPMRCLAAEKMETRGSLWRKMFSLRNLHALKLLTNRRWGYQVVRSHRIDLHTNCVCPGNMPTRPAENVSSVCLVNRKQTFALQLVCYSTLIKYYFAVFLDKINTYFFKKKCFNFWGTFPPEPLPGLRP